MEVFDINGQIISPLAGKTLYVAGDSIAYGKGSATLARARSLAFFAGHLR